MPPRATTLNTMKPFTTLVVFTPAGMRLFRYKTESGAFLFQSLLRLMKINSKVIVPDWNRDNAASN